MSPYRPLVPSNGAFQAFEEARELFYAASLAARATGDPFNAVPLLRRSLLLCLRALALSRGMDEEDRDAVIAAVNALEERDWLLRFPVLAELDRLDELDARFQHFGRRGTDAENEALRRLIAGMPGLFSTIRTYLSRHGVDERTRTVRSFVRKALVALSLAAVLAGGLYARKRLVRAGNDVVPYAGVQATYFGKRDFSDPKVTRTDPNIDFDWGSGAPLSAVPNNGFSIRWSGKLQITAPGPYTFYLASDDGARLFIEDHLVVDNWGDHDYVEMPGTVTLATGVVSFRVEYFDGIGNAAVKVAWATPTHPKATIGAESFVR